MVSNLKNFDQFREAFWKAAAADANLASQFSKANLARMEQGLASYVKKSQQLGGQRSYVLHHKTPIQYGGAVYDLNNLIVVTPRLHKEILDGAYHYGRN